MIKDKGFYAVCLGYLMTMVDITVVNVALHHIKHELNASIRGIQWIIVAYTLSFASLLLTAGNFGEIFSNKRIFIVGIIIFTGASLFCGISPSLLSLQIWRGVQGIGAAFIVPASLSLIAEMFPDINERTKAMGIWAAITGIGAGLGPVIGGVLVSGLRWRSIFFINLPIGIVALTMTIFFIKSKKPDAPSSAKKRFDIPGQITAIISLCALTYVCLEGRNMGYFSIDNIIITIIGIIAFAAFILLEKYLSSPMLPLSLFNNKNFSVGNIVGFFLNLGFFGQLFVLSLYFQEERHLSPLLTGLAILPLTLLRFFGTILSGRLTRTVGPKMPMAIGFIIGAAGFFSQAFITIHTSYIVIGIILLYTGLGMALTLPSMTVCVMNNAPSNKSDIASGLLNTFRQAGSSFGVAIIGSLIDAPNFIHGMRLGMLIAGIAFILSAILTLLFIDGKFENFKQLVHYRVSIH